MDIKTKKENENTVISLRGEIDLYNAPEIRELVEKLITEKQVHIVIDMEEVTYIDSSGIGALISSLNNLKKKNGSLKITNITGSVRKVFELTKLSSFFDIYESIPEALSAK